jgi:hypothetical protein
MEQLSTLSQTIMALNKKEQLIFRPKFAPRKRMPDKKLVHRKYKLILSFAIFVAHLTQWPHGFKVN